MTQKIKAAASEYYGQGLNIVLLNGKKPLHEWKQWQDERQTPADFEALPWSQADGFALIGGSRLNNGLFFGAVDFDVKNVGEEAKEKGRRVLKNLPITQIEETPSGGQHWIYFSRRRPKTISAHHNEASLELIGEGKLCIMAPSSGYMRLNDNSPTIVGDLEEAFYEALRGVGIQLGASQEVKFWFDHEEFAGKRYAGKTPPCITALFKGTVEGMRNEYAIRLASFLINFKGLNPNYALKRLKDWNRFNNPLLSEKELESVVKSAVQGHYVYGCQDEVLRKSCQREECPIAPQNIAKLLTPEELQRAEGLLEDPNFLDYVVAYGRRRLIGEDNVLLLNFLEICSGQTKYPISGIITGFSGSGKNESLRAVKPLIPKEWLFEFTTSTPEAIKYIPETFTGTLIIYEAAGVKGETGSLSLRSIGEGESIETVYPMRKEATGKMEMGRAKTNARNFITTESDIDITPDLYRRVLKYTMSHDLGLTRRVIAKKMREAAFPETLRRLLETRNPASYSETDFQNALRLLNWKSEVILFPHPSLLCLLDLAVTKEQQVALRTHVEKVLNFAKVLALLNQKRRLRLKIGDGEYIIADAEDYLKSLQILRSVITETVSRIEKRQQEVLNLFGEREVLDKHKVAAKLKISAVTAARALKTLASAGYLKEITTTKPYTYELLQKTPNHFVNLEDTSEYCLFWRDRLKKWLNSTLSTCQQRDIIFQILNNEKIAPELSTYNLKGENKEGSSDFGFQNLNSRTPDRQGDKVPAEPNSSLIGEKKPKHLVFSQMISKSKLEDFKAVYWSNGFYGWHPCAVCGQTKLTSWQAETFKGEKVWLCENCKEEWEEGMGDN